MAGLTPSFLLKLSSFSDFERNFHTNLEFSWMEGSDEQLQALISAIESGWLPQRLVLCGPASRDISVNFLQALTQEQSTTNCALRKLSLSGFGRTASSDAWSSLSRLNNLQCLEISLEELDGAPSTSFTGLCTALSAMSALEALDLTVGQPHAVHMISQAISHCSRLRRLSLGSNRIGAPAATALSSALRALPLLEDLSLPSTDDLGLEALALATAATCRNLAALHLRGSTAHAAGAAAMQRALPRLPTLTCLGGLELNIHSSRGLLAALPLCAGLARAALRVAAFDGPAADCLQAPPPFRRHALSPDLPRTR